MLRRTCSECPRRRYMDEPQILLRRLTSDLPITTSLPEDLLGAGIVGCWDTPADFVRLASRETSSDRRGGSRGRS